MSPAKIADQVKAVLGAPDLRAGDLGLCARWLWWQVAATRQLDRWYGRGSAFVGALPGACGTRSAASNLGHPVCATSATTGCLPWRAWTSCWTTIRGRRGGKFLTEREEDRKLRLGLARQVCEPAFINQVNPATNRDHVRRRAWLVVRKAHRLLGEPGATLALPPQQSGELTAIAWLCLAGQSLAQHDTVQDQNPIIP
jgi:hypothetical protein